VEHFLPSGQQNLHMSIGGSLRFHIVLAYVQLWSQICWALDDEGVRNHDHTGPLRRLQWPVFVGGGDRG